MVCITILSTLVSNLCTEQTISRVCTISCRTGWQIPINLLNLEIHYFGTMLQQYGNPRGHFPCSGLILSYRKSLSCSEEMWQGFMKLSRRGSLSTSSGIAGAMLF